MPYSEEPIRYLSDRVNDPVARLQDRIDRGLARLDFEAEHGYLKSVLKQLDVAVSSQTLVFSKSSFQYRKISPQTPRALYYNDNVYVGWVKDGHSLEIASFDPDQGAIFYLLSNGRRASAGVRSRPLIARQCHVATGTRGVPGVLVRSIYTRPSGDTGNLHQLVRQRTREPAQGAIWWLVRHRHARPPDPHGQRLRRRSRASRATST